MLMLLLILLCAAMIVAELATSHWLEMAYHNPGGGMWASSREAGRSGRTNGQLKRGPLAPGQLQVNRH